MTPETLQFKPGEYKAIEVDPNGIAAGIKGAKLDAGKPAVWRGLLDYFPRACIAVADVSTRGAQKYSWKGWEEVKDGEHRYADALARHIVKESIDGLYDIGPGGLGKEVLHSAQIAWNALARLELILRRLENASSNNHVHNVSSSLMGTGVCTADTTAQNLVCGNRACQLLSGMDGL